MSHHPARKQKSARTVVVGTRLPPRLAALLDADAKEDGTSAAKVLREIVAAHYAAELAS